MWRIVLTNAAHQTNKQSHSLPCRRKYLAANWPTVHVNSRVFQLPLTFWEWARSGVIRLCRPFLFRRINVGGGLYRLAQSVVRRRGFWLRESSTLKIVYAFRNAHKLTSRICTIFSLWSVIRHTEYSLIIMLARWNRFEEVLTCHYWAEFKVLHSTLPCVRKY